MKVVMCMFQCLIVDPGRANTTKLMCMKEKLYIVYSFFTSGDNVFLISQEFINIQVGHINQNVTFKKELVDPKPTVC